LDLNQFLSANNISQEDWDKSRLDKELLLDIEKDYKAYKGELHRAAKFLAETLQPCEQVHSVRWRVKEPSHVLEKIVRKRAQGSEKYEKINVDNYKELITDLVGVRVLHLFKSDWRGIHQFITDKWKPQEQVIAYTRKGDQDSSNENYSENGIKVEVHEHGYRSIHYIIATAPTNNQILSEIQVRTIFEEGWSEIDHKIRYPNFSDNELVAYFLTIFNRLSGSADEMGGFVRDLAKQISVNESKFNEAEQKKQEHLAKIEELAEKLSKEQQEKQDKSNSVANLQREIRELRESSIPLLTTSNILNAHAGVDILSPDQIQAAASAVKLGTESLGEMDLASVMSANHYIHETVTNTPLPDGLNQLADNHQSFINSVISGALPSDNLIISAPEVSQSKDSDDGKTNNND
jgi:ppGpp synthetase/RelA/SpoT-type nucleotidyltranferase|tara:strand:- start:2381 stop:3598 length:1218 start_codon:yes stop_codon:yes gene_type:complete